CSRCGKTWTGDRHDRNWARYQHLWLAERAAHLATLAALDDDSAAAARASEILTAYAQRYWRYPNRDNVLGPSRLFFSTYIESLWVCNYLAAATLLKAAGRLNDATVRAVNQVADEAATLIGDYDERFSNRQTWNNAALTAIAVWFEDEDLAQRAIEGQTGLVAHLLRGFGGDGLWYEGENYHLFALRGLLTGLGWARLAGVDAFADPRLAPRLTAALLATSLSALPDLTFPARKDSWYGISLAQPMYLELWEIGLAKLGTPDLANWLAALYRVPPPEPELFESYLHDAVGLPRTAHRARLSLSWWSLLEMLPTLPSETVPWAPGSVLLGAQGFAVLRAGNRYAALECGLDGGGHGHPDRLHLTLHADGVHWLADPGTGLYVARDLFWYRSTLAHNAPRLDGASNTAGDAVCEMFDVQDDWAWVRGRLGGLARTVVQGPAYVVDVLELTGREEHAVELPWHFAGRGDIRTPGRWTDATFADPFVTRPERFVPHAEGPIVVALTADGRQLTAHLLFEGELLRVEGPGLPASGKVAPFYLVRGEGRNLRFVTILEPHSGEPQVRAVRTAGETVEIETTGGVERHRFTGAAWEIERPDAAVRSLRGRQEFMPAFTPLLELEGPTRAVAAALRVGAAPPLDGSLAGFDLSEPLTLGLEDQYRRSEDPYAGPEELSAVAYTAWDEGALYVAVEVTKPDICLRPEDALPLLLDNEPDDIHSDGLQVYVADEGGGDRVGYLIVPEAKTGGVRVVATTDSARVAAPATVPGRWERTEHGYRVTVAVPWPAHARPHVGARMGFDLIINEMLPGRVRRAGQLVWTGGNGWVWLRGDRQDPSRFGVLELVA
ncbi:MAG TPA: heparinase II/III family protein, partial [Gemmatimonadales bacterium]|nr:heparinase II/III family protein [Gemmatimonadales bacterium]